MQARRTPLEGLLVLEPRVFGDERGFFFESYNSRVFEAVVGVDAIFVQDNHSRSAKNVLRGLHYQVQRTQGKLVRVTAGEVFDVSVDIRRGSPTFGRWHGQRLSAGSKLEVWIPPGFAHGFLVLSEYAEFLYKTTDYWMPELERCIRWDDPAIGIDWPLQGAPLLSAKDQQGVPLEAAELL